MLSFETITNYTKILKDELRPAMGCTEPIAIAYAAAKARNELGEMPEHMLISCSGNMIKNVKA
jgi:L-cysteine desulfidase